jgi:cytochrome bd-type quinol oxidase subunit 2
MKMTFYWLTAAAFVGLVIMNIIMIAIQKKQKEITDERDRSIFRRASLWATGTSYTVVVILLLLLTITYTNRNSDAIPVNFSLFIVIIGGATLVLTQAITALIFYGRKFKHE